MKPPSFVIHNPSCSERTEIVNQLIKTTGATLVSAVMLPNGKDGCRASHQAVARLARALHPTKHYLVFEDDCVLSEDWETCIEGMEVADVLYLGYNGKCQHTTFGTHALMLSPKARDKILSESEKLKDAVEDKGAYDHILSKLCRQEGLLTAMPPLDEKERWAVQKKGLKSGITGQIRT
jgi:GR25 family glycosyltransferase involved in LPS biosynthesis